MSRKIMLSALTMVLGAGFAFCQEPSNPPATPTAKSARFFGKVEAVDATANTITLKDRKGESKTFTIPADVKIMAGKNAVAIGEIKVGAEVAVTLDESNAVKSVMVMMGHHHGHRGNGGEAPAPSNP